MFDMAAAAATPEKADRKSLLLRFSRVGALLQVMFVAMRSLQRDGSVASVRFNSTDSVRLPDPGCTSPWLAAPEERAEQDKPAR